MKPAIFLAALAFPLPLGAQETLTFTPEDAEHMTACIESLSDPALSEANPNDVRSQTACIGTASSACMENEEVGSSTIGMTECLARETDWWDSQLNVHYASMEETLEPELFASLREAQRAWIAYKDASCGFEYDLWSAGTIRSLVYGSCVLELTARRAEALAGYVAAAPSR